MSNFKTIPISVELIDDNLNTIDAYRKIEEAGRTCYKSSNKNDDQKITESFIRGLIKSGHTSVIEHLTLTVRIICDRGTSHQLIRHRHISVSQQSTRYVSSLGGLEVIKPLSLDENTEAYKEWATAIDKAGESYSNLIELGTEKDIARAVLPMCLKTELVVTTNVREWRQIIKQRSSNYAHENIRELANHLLELFYKELPVLFEDLKED